MLTHTKRLIEELDNIAPKRDKFLLIESRAKNLIESYINLKEFISKSLPEDQAEELNRRLLNSCKNENASKIVRKIREYKKGIISEGDQND